MKSAFAVLIALGLLAGLGFGGWAIVSRLSRTDPAVCGTEATQRQMAYEGWLADLAGDALDKRGASVTPLGCTEGSAAPKASLVVVDDSELQAVVGTLKEAGCPKITTMLPASCTVETDQGVLEVTLRKASGADADGDYEVVVAEGRRATEG